MKQGASRRPSQRKDDDRSLLILRDQLRRVGLRRRRCGDRDREIPNLGCRRCIHINILCGGGGWVKSNPRIFRFSPLNTQWVMRYDHVTS